MRELRRCDALYRERVACGVQEPGGHQPPQGVRHDESARQRLVAVGGLDLAEGVLES